MSCFFRYARPGCICVLACAVVLALWGCGEQKPDNLLPVSGQIKVDGQPFTRGSISLRADKAKGNSSTVQPYGTVESDGTYKMYTGKHGGAPAGKYFVLVTATEDIDPKNGSATPKS